jgi:hypothetical protein
MMISIRACAAIFVTLCSFVGALAYAKGDSAPKPLPWRNISLSTVDYSRYPVEGGAGIFTLAENGVRKFRLTLHFANGIYSFPVERVPEVSAAAEHLVMGGAGKRSVEELDRYSTENGIGITSSLNAQGNLVVKVEALSSDFPKALDLLKDVLLKPRFEKSAFEVWRQEKIDEFTNLLDGGSARKQMRFMNYAMNRMSLGENHYLSQTLARSSRRALNTLRNEKFAEIASVLVSRMGLDAVLSGDFSPLDLESVKKLVRALPVGEVRSHVWLAERPQTVASSERKVRVAVVQKPDMAQVSAELRILVPHAGYLNALERVDVSLVGDVLSSSGGVVGNDRWTRAMRAESGLSYSPSAIFVDELLEPNTNVAAWRLLFQSPLNRVEEACVLAKKTWDDFSAKGVLPQEHSKSRIVKMNGTLATEATVFDRADALEHNIVRGYLPNPVSTQVLLAHFEAASGTHARANATLSRLAAADLPAYLVLMGNLDKASIEKISALPGFQVVDVLPFEGITKSLQ